MLEGVPAFYPFIGWLFGLFFGRVTLGRNRTGELRLMRSRFHLVMRLA